MLPGHETELAQTFAIVPNMLSKESELLAATVMGIWLANMKHVHTEDILNSKESTCRKCGC